MNRGEEVAVKEVIGWIQRVAVERLELDVEPEELAPDSKFTDLEVTQTGELLNLDSIDLVEVVEVMQEPLAVVLLEDPEFRRLLEERDVTIRTMASFLVKRFELEPGWAPAPPESAK